MNGIGEQFSAAVGLGSLFAADKNSLINQNSNPHQPLTKALEKLDRLQNDQLHRQNKSVVALKVVYQSLASRFDTLSSGSSDNVALQQTDSSAQNSNEQGFDFNSVAKNVLDFVSTTLKGAKANGASDEKIADLFKQARTGIEQGFSDAQKELGDLNQLNEDIAAGIGQSRELIDQGINQLEQQLLPSDAEQETNNQVNVYPIYNVANATSANNVTNSTAIDYSRSAAASLSNTSDLSITTADGDIVTISFSDYQENNNSQQLSYLNNDDGEQLNFINSQSAYRDTNFSFSVNGSLDEGEKQAIGALIKDISKIEKSFFSGNLDKAFEQALKLGYDSSEISAFSLDLTQTQTSSVSQAYSEVSQFNDNPHADEISRNITPVLDFVNQYQQASSQAEQLFGNQDNQMKSLLESVFNAEYGQQQDMLARLNDFVDKLAEKA